MRRRRLLQKREIHGTIASSCNISHSQRKRPVTRSYMPTEPDTDAVFEVLALQQGPVQTLTHQGTAFVVSAFTGGPLTLPAGATHFALALEPAEVTCQAGQYALHKEMYLSSPGELTISGGRGFVVSQLGAHGVFHLGGPLEPQGRLEYIDGCSDSLIIPPPVKGDACLNMLHVPPGIDQTPHTHPSFRLGMIVAGSGICRTAAGDCQLKPGMLWTIRPDGLHSFHTAGSGLRLVAFHPDSDFGPTRDDHPMLNRSHVDGRPVQRS